MAGPVRGSEHDVRAHIERASLETAQRRYRELVDGKVKVKVKGVPGSLVFARLRAGLGG